MDSSNKIIQFFARRLRLIAAAVLLFLGVATASSYGFIKIQVTGGATGGGGYTYTVGRLAGAKATELTSSEASLKRLTRSGNYEISARGPGGGFFALAKVDGFFRTRAVEAKLSPEKSRLFVGDNPAPCMFYGQMLYSYECNEGNLPINIHVPASETTPSYTDNLPSGYLEGLVEGIIKTAEGNLALFQPADAEGGAGRVVMLLDNQLKPVKSTALDLANGNGAYRLAAYKSGFLVYSADFTEAYYYSSVGGNPEKIDIKKPQAAGMNFVSLSASGDRLIAVYSDLADEDVGDSGPKQKIKSEVIDLSSGSRLIIPRSVSSAVACGNRLCALGEGELLVYGAGGKEDYRISGVSQIETVGGNLIAVRKNEVLGLDIPSRTGGIDYSFGEYDFCGLQKIDESRYILCVIAGSNSSALLIDRAAADLDSIDKKLAGLRKLPFINSASVSGGYIYVSPNLGEPQYIQSLDGYGYEPSIKQKVNDQINQAAAKLGIDTAKYRLVNTLR